MSSLTSLDYQISILERFEHEKMFKNTSSLERLNVSNFNTEYAIKTSEIFMGTTALEKINFGNWNEISGVMTMKKVF